MRDVRKIVPPARALSNAAARDQLMGAVVDKEDLVEVVCRPSVSGLARRLGGGARRTIVHWASLRRRLDVQARIELVQPIDAANVYAARMTLDGHVRDVD